MPPVDVVQPGSDPRFQSALDEDELILVHPPAIPIPPTSVENLSTALSSLRSAASEISQAGQDIKSTWQGLQNHYSAPEAEDLFAALNPVETTGDQVHDDLYDVVSALKTFVGTAHRTQQRLRQLRDDAWDLVDEADGDPEWNSDRALAARNGALKRAVNRQWALFQEAERECGNTIRDVCGLSGDYTAASGDGAPGPNDIVWGIDPADVADPGYDLTKWDDWKRMWEDNNHYARNADMPWPLDWTRDAYYAQWDNFGGGMVWGLGVSTVSATGAWSQEGGWASSWGEAKDNAIAHQEEKIQGLGALAGLYGEDGWMNPFSGPEAWNWDGDAWQANAGAAWTEVAHEFVPWREWEDRPAYTVYTGLGNAALTVVAFPVRGGTLLAKLGGGGLNDLGGAGGPDGLSPDALSTHWPNGVGGRPGFSLSEHLSNATGRPWGTGTDLSTRLNELRTGLAARFGTFTAVGGAPNEGSPTRTGHGTGDPSDGHVPQADGLEGSSSPNRAPSPTGTPDRTEAEEERQARELAEEVAEVERYSNEEYLRQRAEQPVLVGAGGGPMEINGRFPGNEPTYNHHGTDMRDRGPTTVNQDTNGSRGGTHDTGSSASSQDIRSTGGRPGDTDSRSATPPTSGRGPSRFFSDAGSPNPDLNEGARKVDHTGDLAQQPVRPGAGSSGSSLVPEPNQRFGDSRQLGPRTEYEVYDKNNNYRGRYVTDENGNIREVHLEAHYAKKAHPELKNPRPNATYFIETRNSNFVYETNSHGRNLTTEGTFTRDSAPRIKSEDSAVKKSAEEYFNAYNKILSEQFHSNPEMFPGLENPRQFEVVQWNGGHVVGVSEYGGIPERLNQVAMIDDVNKHQKNDWSLGSSYRNFETAMLDILNRDLSNLAEKSESPRWKSTIDRWQHSIDQSPSTPEIRVRVSQVYDPSLSEIEVRSKRGKLLKTLTPPPSAIVIDYEINGTPQKRITYPNIPDLK